MAKTISIFAAHSINGWISTDGPVNLGTRFTVTAANTITASRYWKGDQTNNGQVITMRLYNGGTTVMGSATRTQLASDPIGWVTVPFSTAIAVTTGITYTIAFRAATGTAYFVNNSYPLTAFTRAPFSIAANHAVYAYGSLTKPTQVGGNSYAIDVVAGSPVSATPTSILALDTDGEDTTQAWFDARYAEGVRLFITAGTPWDPATNYTTTLDTPRTSIQSQFAMAIKSGMSIGLYTRDPRHYNSGLDAAGSYISRLQFFALDVEPTPGIAVTQSMIDGVVARGVRPIIYAGSGFWASVQGGTANNFSSYPLWDTVANPNLDFGVWQNNADHLAGPPVPYGGWNVEGNYRIGSQQKFEHVLDGINVDLNSFDESFLISIPDNQVVNSWDTVVLTGSGSGVWSQVSGAPQNLQVSGNTATFVASPSMSDQTLVFSYGGKNTTVTVIKSTHGIVSSNGSVTPIRMTRI